jgi:dihydroceramidase
VGSGSFAFHSTLKCRFYLYQLFLECYPYRAILDPMQLVDELNMIYTACLMCYATFSFSQSRVVRQVLGFGLLSLAVFITVCALFSISQTGAKDFVF